MPEAKNTDAGSVNKVRVMRWSKPITLVWQVLVLHVDQHILYFHKARLKARNTGSNGNQTQLFYSTLSLLPVDFFSFPGLLIFLKVRPQLMFLRASITPQSSNFLSVESQRRPPLQREGRSTKTGRKSKTQYLLCFNLEGHILLLLPHSIC